ncbi:MAG TPA: potassium/proton antiporter [Cytophagaceae bacterium]|jgi:cell volume regulation protein A|nr:potassium/proton antiporter [Cytophagaceae bacterium]
MFSLEILLLVISSLIIVSLLIAKVSNNLGVPILLLFLGVGMLAGSEGPGGIYFDDAKLSQSIGIICLIFILFSAGLDTKWKYVKPVLWPSLVLATAGVLVTTALVGIFVHYLFSIDLKIGLLLGAVISSTDASAVFSIIGARNIKLKGRITPLLELESGSNDPMAVFLTFSLIEIILTNEISISKLILHFGMEMGLGLLAGTLFGKLYVWTINSIKFSIDGFYTVITLAFALLIYSFTSYVHGSGFLAVYVAGLIINNYEIVHKKTIFRFFDGIAWLSQICMFLTLGLLVFPSQITAGLTIEIVIALFLIFIARPVGVYLSLIFFKYTKREIFFISFVGLRGAVPIILATFPLLAGISEANWIFNIVFFIVLTSALIQGWSLPFVAKLLKLDSPGSPKINSPIEFSEYQNSNMQLINLSIPENRNDLVNKSVVQIQALRGSLIVTVLRDGKYFVPSGGTVLEPGDAIQVLVENKNAETLIRFFENS